MTDVNSLCSELGCYNFLNPPELPELSEGISTAEGGGTDTQNMWLFFEVHRQEE